MATTERVASVDYTKFALRFTKGVNHHPSERGPCPAKISQESATIKGRTKGNLRQGKNPFWEIPNVKGLQAKSSTILAFSAERFVRARAPSTEVIYDPLMVV